MSTTPARNIQLRSPEPDDELFLLRVYAGERAEELAQVPWDEQQKLAFVRMQFAAQSNHYRAYYPNAEHKVICENGTPVGRLYLNRGAREFCVLDIAMLPEKRGTGTGTVIVEQILQDARKAGVPVTIYVDAGSASVQFFEHRGFRPVEQNGFSVLMRWEPTAGAELTEANG